MRLSAASSDARSYDNAAFRQLALNRYIFRSALTPGFPLAGRRQNGLTDAGAIVERAHVLGGIGRPFRRWFRWQRTRGRQSSCT